MIRKAQSVLVLLAAEFLPALLLQHLRVNIRNPKPRFQPEPEIVLDSGPTEYKDLDKWKACIEAWSKESDRFWARNNIYLAINGALLVAVTSFSNISVLALLVSLFGIAFVLIWVRVIRVGKYYQDRWLRLIEQIESSWESGFVTQFKEFRASDKTVAGLKPSTTYMLYVLRLILILWIVIFFYEALTIIHSSNAGFFISIF